MWEVRAAQTVRTSQIQPATLVQDQGSGALRATGLDGWKDMCMLYVNDHLQDQHYFVTSQGTESVLRHPFPAQLF